MWLCTLWEATPALFLLADRNVPTKEKGAISWLFAFSFYFCKKENKLMRKLRFAFSGIGAVGGYYGGLFAQHHKETKDVFFITRGENLSKMREKGLCIRTHSGDQYVYPTLATDDVNQIGGAVDYLFCCTKAYDLEDNLRQLAPIINADTVIIPLLNGMDITERIEALLPGQKVWKGCVYIGARLIAPGIVEKFSVKERLFFGNSETDDRTQQSQLLQWLQEAGLNAFNPDDIEVRIWKKFFMISTAAVVTSYLDLSIGETLEQHRDLFVTLSEELKQVADAADIPLEEDVVERSIETQSMMPPGSITSMHADFRKGKQTELETLAGSVIRLAERKGVAVPTYQMMYDALKKRSANG